LEFSVQSHKFVSVDRSRPARAVSYYGTLHSQAHTIAHAY
jgi:hypothetical protein